MIFSSFLSFFTGDKGPFALLGVIFLIFALFQRQLIHFVQFEDHSHEVFNIQVTNIYQQPFIIHSYQVKRYSLTDSQEAEEAGWEDHETNTNQVTVSCYCW